MAGLSNSPQLNAFFDKIITTPVDIDGLKNAFACISDSTERTRALEAINSATQISMEDRRELRNTIVAQSGTRPEKKPNTLLTNPAQIRPPEKTQQTSSVQIEQTIEHPKLAQEILAQNPAIVDTKSLAEIGVTPLQAVSLGVERIGNSLTEQIVKNYQSDHGIDIDGVIGREAYCEMYAGAVLEQAQYKIDEYGINPKTQEKILWVLQNGNPAGENVNALLRFMGDFREKYKDNEKYKGFFERLDVFMNNPSGNPHLKDIEEEVTKPNAHGGSPLGDIPEVIEGNMTMNEYIERNKGTGIVVAIIGFIFFGNKIPGLGKIPGMGNWFGRIAWLVGGTLLGGGKLLNYGIDKVQDGIGYFSTPEAKQKIQQTKESTEKLAQSVWDKVSSKVDGFDGESFSKKFDSLIQSFETRSNTLKDTNGNPLIVQETFLGLTGILEDDIFFNLSIDDLKKIKTKDELYRVIGVDSQSKLNNLDINDVDVENFVQKYLLPEFEGQEFVGGYFFDVVAKTVEFSGKEYLPGNKTLNTEIREDIINLTRIGSEAQKRAGDALKKAVLLGDIEDFSLDNHPSLSLTEKTDIQEVVDKIKYIFSIEGKDGFIQKQVQKIQDIALEAQSQNSGETEITLKSYFNELDEIKKVSDAFISFQDKDDTENFNINVESFSWRKIDSAYETKRLEILKYADNLGLTEVGDIDVIDELGRVELQKKALEQEQDVQELLEEIEKNFPTKDDTPLKLRAWYSANTANFERLEEMINSGKLSTDLETEVVNGLKKREEFISIYTEVRDKKIAAIQALEKKIKDIEIVDEVNATQYKATKDQLEKTTQEYSLIMKNIVAGILSIESLLSFFGKDYENENSIISLDDAIDEIESIEDFSFNRFKTLVQEKNTTLEQAYSVQVNIDSLDITEGTDVKDTVDEMRAHAEIVQGFSDSNVSNRKYKEIQEQAVQIEQKYLDAIKSVSSIIELEALQASYKNSYNPNEWKDFIEKITWRKDSIDSAFEAKRLELQLGDIIIGDRNEIVRGILERSGTYDFLQTYKSTLYKNETFYTKIAALDDDLEHSNLFSLNIALKNIPTWFSEDEKEIPTNKAFIDEALKVQTKLEKEIY